MRARLFAVAKYVVYPTFYLFCLFACIYLTFPWDQLKTRIEAEFDKSQASKGDRAWDLEITSIDGYWLTGVELTGAKITMPPDEEEETKSTPKSSALSRMTGGAATPRNPRAGAAADDDASDDAGGDSPSGDAKDDKAKEKDEAPKPPQPSVIVFEEAHARVRILPLLIGRVRIDFAATVFGGSVEGVIPIGGGDLAIELKNLDLSQVAPLKDMVSVPLKGMANGKLELTAANGKWSKATGGFNLTVSDMVMGDGKAKFRGLAVLPPANIGVFELAAKAEAGLLKVEKFGASGQDLELSGEGTIKLREPWDASVADLWLKFGFSEGYKNQDERMQALFVDDGPFPALISQDRKMKRAKRQDGLWGFHIHGKLQRLRYDPTTADGPKGKAAAAGGETAAAKKKKSADDDDDDGADAPTPTVAAPATAKRAPSFPGMPPRPGMRQNNPPDTPADQPPDQMVPEPAEPAPAEPAPAEPNAGGEPEPGPDPEPEPAPPQ